MKRNKIREIILNLKREQRCNRNENSTDPNYEEWLQKMNATEFHFLRGYSAFETVRSQKSLLDEGAPSKTRRLKENSETRQSQVQLECNHFPAQIVDLDEKNLTVQNDEDRLETNVPAIRRLGRNRKQNKKYDPDIFDVE